MKAKAEEFPGSILKSAKVEPLPSDPNSRRVIKQLDGIQKAGDVAKRLEC